MNMDAKTTKKVRAAIERNGLVWTDDEFAEVKRIANISGSRAHLVLRLAQYFSGTEAVLIMRMVNECNLM